MPSSPAAIAAPLASEDGVLPPPRPEDAIRAGEDGGQGMRTGIPRELLFTLTEDVGVAVRPPLLRPEPQDAPGAESSGRAGTALARRIALLLPDLPRERQASLHDRVLGALTGLAAEAATRTRAAVATAAADLAPTSRALVQALAREVSPPLGDPVIRLLPTLTSRDLLPFLVTAPDATPHSGRRVGPVRPDSVPAVAAALLGNATAGLREAALDAILARQPQPVRAASPPGGPTLQPRAARVLSGFVAASFLRAVLNRAKLEPDVAAALKQRVTSLLHPPPFQPEAIDVLEEAFRLQAAGRLTENALLDACRRGDARLAAAILAVAARVSAKAVARAVQLRSGKGLVSLAWRGGFSMEAATAVQSLLACLPSEAAVRPGPGGCYPLGVEEMRWHLENLTRLPR